MERKLSNVVVFENNYIKYWLYRVAGTDEFSWANFELKKQLVLVLAFSKSLSARP